MRIQQENFNQLVERALRDANIAGMRPVIEKELLHFDMLFALEREGLLDQLTFQGGTALRLCYGANRLSEDLDFVGGPDFTAESLRAIKSCIEIYIGQRYDLEVIVKEPAALRQEPEYAELKVDKWQVAVTTAPARRDLPKQKIKLEVANVPAHTREPRSLRANYDFLPDGYSDTLVLTESLNEIMADKLISLPATEKYVRYRDMWDLLWLQQQRAELTPALVRHKVVDYDVPQYEQKLNGLIKRLPDLLQSEKFHVEMRRFVPTDVFQRTLATDKFLLYATSSLTKLFEDTQRALFAPEQRPEFQM